MLSDVSLLQGKTLQQPQAANDVDATATAMRVAVKTSAEETAEETAEKTPEKTVEEAAEKMLREVGMLTELVRLNIQKRCKF